MESWRSYAPFLRLIDRQIGINAKSVPDARLSRLKSAGSHWIGRLAGQAGIRPVPSLRMRPQKGYEPLALPLSYGPNLGRTKMNPATLATPRPAPQSLPDRSCEALRRCATSSSRRPARSSSRNRSASRLARTAPAPCSRPAAGFRETRRSRARPRW